MTDVIAGEEVAELERVVFEIENADTPERKRAIAAELMRCRQFVSMCLQARRSLPHRIYLALERKFVPNPTRRRAADQWHALANPREPGADDA